MQRGPKGVAIESVAAAADALVAAGARPTLRAVREAVGKGSLATIQKHLTTWLVTQPHKSLPIISETLLRSIQAEIAKHLADGHAEYSAALEDLTTARDLIAQEAEEHRLNLEYVRNELVKLQEQWATLLGKYEQLHEDATKTEKRLIHELEEHKGLLKAVTKQDGECEASRRVAEARSEAAEKRANEAEARARQLFEQILSNQKAASPTTANQRPKTMRVKKGL